MPYSLPVLLDETTLDPGERNSLEQPRKILMLLGELGEYVFFYNTMPKSGKCEKHFIYCTALSFQLVCTNNVSQPLRPLPASHDGHDGHAWL